MHPNTAQLVQQIGTLVRDKWPGVPISSRLPLILAATDNGSYMNGFKDRLEWIIDCDIYNRDMVILHKYGELAVYSLDKFVYTSCDEEAITINLLQECEVTWTETVTKTATVRMIDNSWEEFQDLVTEGDVDIEELSTEINEVTINETL